MGLVKHFRELRVYREAFDAAMRGLSHGQLREDGAEYGVPEELTHPHTPTHE